MIGTRLEHYEITRHLGTGGMGEVYQATDTKLGRSVAIKLLPEVFADDAERAARFKREARILGSLNHPHVAAIYGIEESGGRQFLVMELVEGETLAERMRRGPVPVSEALEIARQIAEGLEAAHEKGIVHRDLKPSNVKVTRAGKTKILDFGLAKAFQGGPQTSLSSAPTIDDSAPGVILGTVAYMSPEQASGKESDPRSDIWAFGCVLYEMLTAQAVFKGDSVAEILADVMKVDPDWNRLPPGLTESIRRLLRRCLERERGERLQHIGDARIEIKEAQRFPANDRGPVQTVSRRKERMFWISMLVLLLILIVAGWLGGGRAALPAPEAEVRLELNTPPTSDQASIAISPDGQRVVFVATSDGRPRLWLRPLDSVSASPLAGTDGAGQPFWSGDSRSIGFFADGKLKRIDLDGGLVRPVAIAPNPLGGAWNRDGTILFTPNFSGPIFRVSAEGNEEPVELKIDAQQPSQRFPQFLPDGRHFLYYVPVGTEAGGVFAAELEGGPAQRLTDADAPGIYASSGHLLFVRGGTLIAQALDPVKLVLSGSLYPIAEDVRGAGFNASVPLSASAAGPFIYRAGATNGLRQFIWFDRSGNEIRKVGGPDSFNPNAAQISLDGRRIATSRTVDGNADIWLLDLATGQHRRFTTDPGADLAPVFSPDADRIVFSSNRSGVVDLYEKAVTGSGGENLLLTTSQNKGPSDWSRDGRFILFRSPSGQTGFDIWALPLEGDRKPFPVVQTKSEERDAQFSPNGDWIAYQSNESGRMEIWIQPFRRPEDRVQVSTDGGGQVRWRGDQLFYIALDGWLTAVPVRLNSGKQSAEWDSPVRLFPTRVGGSSTVSLAQYVVSPDGQSFLMNTLNYESTVPITVVLNWKSRL